MKVGVKLIGPAGDAGALVTKQILNITGKNQNRASNLHVPVNDFKFRKNEK